MQEPTPEQKALSPPNPPPVVVPPSSALLSEDAHATAVAEAVAVTPPETDRLLAYGVFRIHCDEGTVLPYTVDTANLLPK